MDAFLRFEDHFDRQFRFLRPQWRQFELEAAQDGRQDDLHLRLSVALSDAIAMSNTERNVSARMAPHALLRGEPVRIEHTRMRIEARIVVHGVCEYANVAAGRYLIAT